MEIGDKIVLKNWDYCYLELEDIGLRWYWGIIRDKKTHNHVTGIQCFPIGEEWTVWKEGPTAKEMIETLPILETK